MYCPACGTRNPDSNAECLHCRQPLRPMAPLPQMQVPQGRQSDGTLGGLIPIHNPKALASYYLGLFSLFPLLGFFLGIAAVVLGVQGMKLVKQHPEARGKAHAIVGITCGTLFGLFNFLLLVVVIIALVSAVIHPPTPGT